MKLRWSPTSPYTRKVTVTAHETGLHDRIERIPTNVWDPATDIGETNPLGKIPTLITEGGEVLFDSPVVCEYLDSLHDGVKLFPPTGGARWRALKLQAVGDGITDAAVAVFLERKRADGERSDAWIDRQKTVIGRSTEFLEDEVATLGGAATIGHIAVGCALGYVDFRIADLDWRQGRPGLARWYAEFALRPSMAQTVPRDPT